MGKKRWPVNLPCLSSDTTFDMMLRRGGSITASIPPTTATKRERERERERGREREHNFSHMDWPTMQLEDR